MKNPATLFEELSKSFHRMKAGAEPVRSYRVPSDSSATFMREGNNRNLHLIGRGGKEVMLVEYADLPDLIAVAISLWMNP